MADSSKRRYAAKALSTDTNGRMLCTCRDIHFVADGPVANGLPGEAITPGELFLSGVAACAVELVQVFANADELPIGPIEVSKEDAKRLVERFKGR